MIGNRVRVKLKNGEWFEGTLRGIEHGPTVVWTSADGKGHIVRFFPIDTVEYIDQLDRPP